VITAVDELIKATRCSPTSSVGCQGTSARCLTHHLWVNLGSHIMSYLGNITLMDVCSEKRGEDVAA
jgi:DNA-binding IscR family transcriptional regulator